MTESELQDLRRQRLATWIADHDGVIKALKGRQYPDSYPSYISQILKGYSFGSRAARTCEERFGMPSLWLDTPEQTKLSAKEISPQEYKRSITIAEALNKLGEELAREISTDAREDIADALSKMAKRGGLSRDQQIVMHLLDAARSAATQPDKRAA